MSLIVGYRVDFRPGDPCYYTPAGFRKELRAAVRADVWGLYLTPQPGQPQEVEVFKSWCWVRPKYRRPSVDDADFQAYYLGKQLCKAKPDEAVAFLFPSLFEPGGDDFTAALEAIEKASR